ncbi:MAG: hypothetical protein ABI678_18145, partial [Kofleriaceae bacterium]
MDREVERAIEEGLATARERWPQLPIGDALTRYIAERADTQPGALARLRVVDLALAWWAGTGDARAILAFEATYASALAKLLQRFHRMDPEELRQQLRVKLFTGDRPRIREYSGFGHLENWFKIIAARLFVDLARAQGRERIDDVGDQIAELAAAGANPRDAMVRAELVATVKAALEAAIANLAGRERTFLRHAMIDALTLEQIAATYRLHRVTVARVLAAARRELFAATRAQVCERLGVDPDQLGSMLQLI